MKQFLRLACTVCKRQVDEVVNLTHFRPDQCTITAGCEGRLRPVEYRSTAGVGVTPEIGVSDWRPRNSTQLSSTNSSTVASFIGLSTGALNQLVIASPVDAANLSVQFSARELSSKEFKQFVFRKTGAFNSIVGVESGLEKKTLRFTAFGPSPDLVEVFVNGVKREPGTGPEDYQLATSASSGVPQNTILFNEAITAPGTTQVDVIVSKARNLNGFSVLFKRQVEDESRVAKGAFENVASVERLVNGVWATYHLYRADFSSESFGPNSIVVPVGEDQFFLLANPPFTARDRFNSVVADFSSFSIERDYIKVEVENGQAQAKCPTSVLTSVFPLLKFNLFSGETLVDSLVGNDEAVMISNDFIVGPHA